MCKCFKNGKLQKYIIKIPRLILNIGLIRVLLKHQQNLGIYYVGTYQVLYICTVHSSHY